jgi:hypothetical protein
MDFETDLPSLFAAANASTALFDRVDQTWAEATEDPRGYLQAAHAMVEVIVVGLTRQLQQSGHIVEIHVRDNDQVRQGFSGQTLHVYFDPSNLTLPTDVLGYELFDDLFARVAPVPLQSSQRPGRAVALAALRTFGAMTDVKVHVPELAELETRYPEADWSPSAYILLSRIIEYLTPNTAAAMAKIRRVMRPPNEEVLASWLKRSRPTVRSWTNSWTASEGDARLRVVSRLAQLLDEQLDPDETERYIYDTRIEALGGVSFAQALTEFETPELSQAVEGLATALVW